MPQSPVYSRSDASPYGAGAGQDAYRYEDPYQMQTSTPDASSAINGLPYNSQGGQGFIYQGGPLPAGYRLVSLPGGRHLAVPIAGYQGPEGPRPQYLTDIYNVLGASENAQVRKAGLESDIYGGNDPLSRQYGRLNAIQAAQERTPGIVAGAVQAHHQMKDAQAWQLYMTQLQQQFARENAPKHHWYDPILGIAGQVAGSFVGGRGGGGGGDSYTGSPVSGNATYGPAYDPYAP